MNDLPAVVLRHADGEPARATGRGRQWRLFSPL